MRFVFEEHSEQRSLSSCKIDFTSDFDSTSSYIQPNPAIRRVEVQTFALAVLSEPHIVVQQLIPC
jgi:hypothetical protein